MSEIETWHGKGLTVDADRILRVHGYRDPQRIRPALTRAAEQAARRSAEIVAPEARVARLPIEACAAASLRLAGGFSFDCPVFGAVLGGCDEALVVVITLGPGLEGEIAERYAASEALEAYLLDSAGWLLVEQASHRLRADYARRLAPEGRTLTMRLGPGYDYRDGESRARWPLEQQQELFRIFDGAALPVELLDSSAMLPRMSRTGLYGIAPRRGG